MTKAAQRPFLWK